jgi:hypothetical protein
LTGRLDGPPKTVEKLRALSLEGESSLALESGAEAPHFQTI